MVGDLFFLDDKEYRGYPNPNPCNRFLLFFGPMRGLDPPQNSPRRDASSQRVQHHQPSKDQETHKKTPVMSQQTRQWKRTPY